MSFFAILVLIALVLVAVKTLRLDRLGSARPRHTRHDISGWGRPAAGTDQPDEPPTPGDETAGRDH